MTCKKKGKKRGKKRRVQYYILCLGAVAWGTSQKGGIGYKKDGTLASSVTGKGEELGEGGSCSSPR